MIATFHPFGYTTIFPVNKYVALTVATTTSPEGRQAFTRTEVDLTDSYAPPAVPDSAGGISYLYDKDKKLLSTIISDSSAIEMV